MNTVEAPPALPAQAISAPRPVWLGAARSAVLAAAVLGLGLLLWRLDPRQVWAHLAGVGWGMALILAQEIVAHVFNAAGWRSCFRAREAGVYSLAELVRLRVAGDAVNYLTPSGTVAGEFIRAVALPPGLPTEARYASVAASKLAQALAQALFILAGLLWLLAGAGPALAPHAPWLRWSAAGVVGFVMLLAGAALWARGRLDAGRDLPWTGRLGALASVPKDCVSFLRDEPARFAASVAWFMAGYAWGAFEAFWICRFLGVPVTPASALSIEVLSCFLDGVLFMVPAKVGTQEAGKTAVFAVLGLDPRAGFAFGVVRHARELAWSAGGLLLCRRQGLLG